MKLRNKRTGEIAEIKLKLNESLPDAIRRTIEEAGWEETREPLIKDEKIRKAVRAWAEANDIKEIIIFDSSNNAPYTPVGAVEFAGNASRLKVLFRTGERFDTNMIYTIEELCGEDKPRPVIVNDIKYSSYEDYLKSREKK
jgi:hypothetical protein